MSAKSPGRRIEHFSVADVIARGREARRKRRPIWTKPFTRERALVLEFVGEPALADRIRQGPIPEEYSLQVSLRRVR